MKIDKVNAILLKALERFRQGEIEDIRVGEENVQFEGMEIAIARLAQKVVEAKGCSFEEGLDEVIEVAGTSAARAFVSNNKEATEESVTEWLGLFSKGFDSYLEQSSNA